MKKEKIKKEKRLKRHKRGRAKISGISNKPRISVFISNRHIYVQVIDDQKGKTIANISDLNIKEKDKKLNVSKEMGLALAKELKKLKIEKAVFDRGGFKYHGRVKNIAEGLREGGIKF